MTPPGGDTRALLDATRSVYVPNAVLVVATEGDDSAAQRGVVPLLEGMRAMRGKPTAYVCRGTVGDLPTTDPNVFASQFARVEPLPK